MPRTVCVCACVRVFASIDILVHSIYCPFAHPSIRPSAHQSAIRVIKLKNPLKQGEEGDRAMKRTPQQTLKSIDSIDGNNEKMTRSAINAD